MTERNMSLPVEHVQALYVLARPEVVHWMDLVQVNRTLRVVDFPTIVVLFIEVVNSKTR